MDVNCLCYRHWLCVVLLNKTKQRCLVCPGVTSLLPSHLSLHQGMMSSPSHLSLHQGLSQVSAELFQSLRIVSKHACGEMFSSWYPVQCTLEAISEAEGRKEIL